MAQQVSGLLLIDETRIQHELSIKNEFISDFIIGAVKDTMRVVGDKEYQTLQKLVTYNDEDTPQETSKSVPTPF